MIGRTQPRGVLGVFEHTDQVLAALRAARHAQLSVRDVYSPVPFEQAREFVTPGRSPVRFVTFIGAVTGLVSGLALAFMTSDVWNLVVAGKPVDSIVPFLVVGFELTILFGALATLIALLVLARLPSVAFPGPAYREQFSLDRFGVWIDCADSDERAASELLRQAGASDVQRIAAATTEAA
jgi:hypothetical protein